MTMLNKLREFLDKKIIRWLCIGFIALVGLLAVYSFVKTPFTGDIKVFMSAANHVKYKDSGILMSIFEAWELKGIASRILMFVIYVIADFFVGFENKLLFEATCKLIYALILIAIFVLTAVILPTSNKNRFAIGGIMFFAFFATGTASQMQVEMTCIAICLLAAACLIRNKTWSLILCGFLCSLLFFFKSIFLLLFASVLICGALYNLVVKKALTKRSFLIPLVAFAVCELLLVAAVAMVYPQEFADMAHASEYQATLLSEDSNVSFQSITSRFSQNFTLSAVMIPILLIGVIGTLYEVITAIKEKKHLMWISLVALWIISIDIIIVSNMYFVYHYFLLVLPSVVGTILYFKRTEKCILQITVSSFLALSAVTGFNVLLGADYEIGAINNSTALLVCLHLFVPAITIFVIGKYKKTHAVFTLISLTVCFFLWANFLTALAPYYKNLRTFDKYSYIYTQRDIPSDIGDEEVLFLDSGAASFYIDAPSYSRYFFNLPLQRWTPQDEWDWKDEEYEKILSYDGKYVVVDYGWLKMDYHPELKQKLADEYVALETENLRVWSPYWQWYNLADFEKFTDNEQYSTGLRILVRK